MAEKRTHPFLIIAPFATRYCNLMSARNQFSKMSGGHEVVAREIATALEDSG